MHVIIARQLSQPQSDDRMLFRHISYLFQKLSFDCSSLVLDAAMIWRGGKSL